MSEVERLADHLVLLKSGRVVASGPRGHSYEQPVAGCPCTACRNRSRGARACIRAQDGLTTLHIDGGALLVPGHVGKLGSVHRIRIAAEEISLSVDRPSRTTILNVLSAPDSEYRTPRHRSGKCARGSRRARRRYKPDCPNHQAFARCTWPGSWAPCMHKSRRSRSSVRVPVPISRGPWHHSPGKWRRIQLW